MSGSFLEQILVAVEKAPAPRGMTTKIVAIDGPGGAGKTTLASALAKALGGAPVVHTDDFASWENPTDWWPRLLREALEPLARGERLRFVRTDWEGRGRETWLTVEPAAVVVLEGVTASRDAFRPFLTYSIWIETPRELRLARGLERDGEAMRAAWERWMAGEDAYVERERPHERADLVLPGDRNLWS